MNMIKLECCLSTCGEKGLARALASALEAVPPGALPLRECCNQGGWVDDSALTVSVLELRPDPQCIEARVGVFLTELVGGCNCHDDPAQVNAYGVFEVRIDRISGLAEIVPDSE